jgi:hypothetical protein
MLVAGNFSEVGFDGVKYFFKLNLTSLLEKHLAEEISDWVHHELVESGILE